MENKEDPLSKLPSLSNFWKADTKTVFRKIREWIVGNDLKPTYIAEAKLLEEIPLKYRDQVKAAFTNVKRETTLVNNQKVERVVSVFFWPTVSSVAGFLLVIAF